MKTVARDIARDFLKIEKWSTFQLSLFMVFATLATAAWNMVLFGLATDRPWQLNVLAVVNWLITICFVRLVVARWVWPRRKESILDEIDRGFNEAERRINTGEIPVTKMKDQTDHE